MRLFDFMLSEPNQNTPFWQFLEYCLPVFIYLHFNLKDFISLSIQNFICTVTIPLVLKGVGFSTHMYTPKYGVTTVNIYVFLIQ